jgi:hypothetical protein
VVTVKPLQLYSQVNSFLHPSYRRLGGPQSVDLEAVEKRIRDYLN